MLLISRTTPARVAALAGQQSRDGRLCAPSLLTGDRSDCSAAIPAAGRHVENDGVDVWVAWLARARIGQEVQSARSRRG